MFEKLLALLPYNPGLVHQLSFYSRRMKEESVIRRTGTVVIVLAFMVQFFAVISPPATISAYSTNDLVDGGISSAADAANKCYNNVKSYKDIMETFGITCTEIAHGYTENIVSTNNGGNLYSFGWLPQGQVNHNTGRRTNETPFSIINYNKDVYGRLLHSWDSGPSSTYKALRIVTASGKVFLILYNCGNLVSVGLPPEVPRCQYNNAILYNNPSCIKPCPYNSSLAASSPQCFPPCQYNKSISASSPNCFAHCPLPGLTNLPQTSPQCQVSCPYNASIPASSPSCFQPCQYNSSISSTSPSCYPPCKYNSGISATNPSCFPPCQYNNLISSSDQNCKPCDKSVSTEDKIACISVHKSAANITTGTNNADGTTANPDDVINYTLYAVNSGKAAVDKFTFQENMSYVVDYADITDLHGGVKDTNNVISWPSQTIAAGETAKQQITVKVKDPIPANPVDPSDPNLFNLTMTNVYGNAINIKVPAPPQKIVEAATTTTALPNTGPGTGLLVAAVIVIIAGYFYSRARLLSVESSLAIHETI